MPYALYTSMYVCVTHVQQYATHRYSMWCIKYVCFSAVVLQFFVWIWHGCFNFLYRVSHVNVYQKLMMIMLFSCKDINENWRVSWVWVSKGKNRCEVHACRRIGRGRRDKTTVSAMVAGMQLIIFILSCILLDSGKILRWHLAYKAKE